jgi:hypothetical protein
LYRLVFRARFGRLSLVYRSQDDVPDSDELVSFNRLRLQVLPEAVPIAMIYADRRAVAR